MELKNKVVLERKIDEHVFRFELPAGAPLSFGYQALLEYLDKVLRLLQDHAQKYQPQKPVEEKAEAEAPSEEEEAKVEPLEEAAQEEPPQEPPEEE